MTYPPHPLGTNAPLLGDPPCIPPAHSTATRLQATPTDEPQSYHTRDLIGITSKASTASLSSAAGSSSSRYEPPMVHLDPVYLASSKNLRDRVMEVGQVFESSRIYATPVRVGVEEEGAGPQSITRSPARWDQRYAHPKPQLPNRPPPPSTPRTHIHTPTLLRISTMLIARAANMFAIGLE